MNVGDARRTGGKTWIYLVGPIIGALIGVAFEWILKGKPTCAGAIAAQGSFDINNPAKPD